MDHEGGGMAEGASADGGPSVDSTGAPPLPPPPGWRLRLLALIEVVACSGFPTQIAIAALLAACGIGPFNARGGLSAAYVFTLSTADAVALTALVAWFLRVHGERPAAVLLGRRPVAREALVGIFLIPFAFLLVVLVMGTTLHFAPWLHDVARNPMEGLISSRLDAGLFAAVAVLAGGWREEVQRAFILHRFEQHLGGAVLGLLLFSVVFGAGHLIQGRDVAVTTSVLGLFWGVVYLRRRSIASTVVSHSGFNLAEIVRYLWTGV